MITHEQVHDDLALYMLGEVDAARAAQFREHIDACPTCTHELQQMQSDAALYALSASGPAPPARARDRFLNAITREQRSQSEEAPVRRWAWTPAFAAIVCAFLAIFYWVRSAQLERTIAAQLVRINAQQTEVDRQQTLLDAFNSPDAVQVSLTSTANKPQPQGRVIYVPKRGTVMFFANYFAPAPDHRTYQLWLVPKAGAPMPCGTFKPDQKGSASFIMEYMAENIEAKAFAVTLEPEGGSQTPTMPIIMVSQSS